MRFYEGCGIVKVEYWTTRNRSLEYISKLFSEARKVPIYIVSSPTVVTTRILGVLRRLAIAPGSAIVCEPDALQRFEDYIELSEPTWIDAKLLVPYTYGNPCEHVSRIGIELGIDKEIGVYHRCCNADDIASIEESLKEVMQGGFVHVVDRGEEIEDRVLVALKFNEFFLFWKAFSIGSPYTKVKVTSLKVSDRFGLLLDPLARLGNRDLVMGIGQGYVVLFEPLDEVSSLIYAMTLLLAHSFSLENPRAKLYLEKLVGETRI